MRIHVIKTKSLDQEPRDLWSNLVLTRHTPSKKLVTIIFGFHYYDFSHSSKITDRSHPAQPSQRNARQNDMTRLMNREQTTFTCQKISPVLPNLSTASAKRSSSAPILPYHSRDSVERNFLALKAGCIAGGNAT